MSINYDIDALARLRARRISLLRAKYSTKHFYKV
jgi:hypothetical protein